MLTKSAFKSPQAADENTIAPYDFCFFHAREE